MENAAGQSRPSTAADNVPQLGPIPMFDLHLKFLSDSYLSFFQERKRIEEAYIDALTKLHRRVTVIDTYLDDRGELSTARSAWNEVRDHVDREAQTRVAFLNSLSTDVLNPLIAFRESQERTRKRIKEDIKQSSIAYDEYAENGLPKLKRAYLKRCQDVEDYKAAAAAAPPIPIQPPLSPVEGGAPKQFPAAPQRPVVTAPQPLRPLDRRPSGGPARNRSPSSSTALSDLAHQGKRQLNQLMTFLDKGNGGKDGLGGGRSENPLRTVRAKREADEADKEYRKGVHWLETLRIRRMKILEAGYLSLELFISEAAETLKDALDKYSDNLIATSTTQTQLSSHLRDSVDKISPVKDVAVVSSRIPRSLASAIPKPILYYNYNVGECNDLIFGVSLVDYGTARGLSDGEIPKIVRICIHEVDQRGLDSEGIYRVSGRHAMVQELSRRIERNEREFKIKPLTDDVYVVSSFLKAYLRELPEPVFKYTLQDRIQHSEDFDDHKSNNFALLKAKMRRLPAVHQATLKAIVEHLARVVAHSGKNKMDAKNLAIVFGGVIFGEDDLPKAGADLLSFQSYQDSLMEDMIEHAHILFDDRSETPLPPPPPGETPAKVSYGSAHTKVGAVPPPLALASQSQSPRNSPRYASQSLPPDDFAPQMPARPTNSIHPSSRAGGPASPTKARHTLPPPPPLPPRASLEARPPGAAPAEYERESVPPSPAAGVVALPSTAPAAGAGAGGYEHEAHARPDDSEGDGDGASVAAPDRVDAETRSPRSMTSRTDSFESALSSHEPPAHEDFAERTPIAEGVPFPPSAAAAIADRYEGRHQDEPAPTDREAQARPSREYTHPA